MSKLDKVKEIVRNDSSELVTDIDNVYKVTNSTPLVGYCKEHGIINKSVRQLIEKGSLCNHCNRVCQPRQETLVLGTVVPQKGGHCLQITNLLKSPYVEVVDVDYKDRGSFKVLRGNLFSSENVRSPVRPFHKDWEAFLGVGEYDTVNSRIAHSKWSGMFSRCYSNTAHNKVAYEGCSVSVEWYNFQTFAKWYYDNYPEDGLEYHLDKDILYKGNKVYSPETCCFVPADINSLFTSRKNHRGDNLLGVYYKKKNKKFCAQCADGSGGAQVYLGLYETQEEAFLVYKEFKESVIKKQANKFKDRISDEVYNKLINYVVEKGD